MSWLNNAGNKIGYEIDHLYSTGVSKAYNYTGSSRSEVPISEISSQTNEVIFEYDSGNNINFPLPTNIAATESLPNFIFSWS